MKNVNMVIKIEDVDDKHRELITHMISYLRANDVNVKNVTTWTHKEPEDNQQY